MTDLQQAVVVLDIYVIGAILTAWFLNKPGARRPLGRFGVGITVALWPVTWALAIVFAFIIVVFTKEHS